MHSKYSINKCFCSNKQASSDHSAILTECGQYQKDIIITTDNKERLKKESWAEVSD